MDVDDFSNITALAVEDDLSGGAIISVLLRRLGIRTYLDTTGERTLTLARELDLPPDIIFLDLNLPKRNGFDILKQIRADDQLKNVRVIAVTAMDTDVGIPKCKQAGFDGFIAKPLRMTHFADQIRRILSGEPVWDAG